MKGPMLDIYQDGDGGKSIHSSFNVNQPLPWCILAAMLSAFAFAYVLTETKAAREEAWVADTQSLMLREHVDQLRFELASHGIIPPPIQECKTCQTRQ